MKYLVLILATLFIPSLLLPNQQPEIIKELIEENVIQMAAQDPDLESFVTAVQAAGLDKELSGPGPFIIFAPSNQAFSKIKKPTFAELLKPENKSQLRAILLYAIVPGRTQSSDLTNSTLPTANGENLRVKVEKSKIMINQARIIKGDIEASNGIIHIIDQVLIPKQ